MSAESSLLAASGRSRFAWFGGVEWSGQLSPHKAAFEARVWCIFFAAERACWSWTADCLSRSVCDRLPLPLQPRFQPQVSSHMKNVEFALFPHLRHSLGSQPTCMSPETQHGASTGLRKAAPGSWIHLGLLPVTFYAAIFSGRVSPGHYLLVVAISQNPVLLLRVKEETEDVES